jgi:hypothetical protein
MYEAIALVVFRKRQLTGINGNLPSRLLTNLVNECGLGRVTHDTVLGDR